MRLKSIAWFAPVVLAACSGSGISPAPLPPTAVPPGGKPAVKTTAVKLSITIPRTGSAANRVRPLYISAATQSIGISVNGGAAVFANTSPGSAACPNPTTSVSLVCSISVAAPFGQDSFLVSLYSAPNGGGALLSSGTASQVIAAGINNVNVTFDGVIKSIAIAFGTCTSSSVASTPVNVSALDASGNTIIGPGPYLNAIALFDPDGSGATSLRSGTSSGSTVAVTGTNQSVNLDYTGAALSAPLTLTATVPNQPGIVATSPPLSQAQLACAPVISAPQTLSLAAGTTKTFTATEAGFTGTMTATVAPSGAGSLAVTIAPGASGATEQFVAGGLAQSSGPISVTLSDGNAAHSATIAVTVTAPVQTGIACAPASTTISAISGDTYGGSLAVPGLSSGGCLSAQYAEGTVITPPFGLPAPTASLLPANAQLLYVLGADALNNLSLSATATVALNPPNMGSFASFGEIVYEPGVGWIANPQANACTVASGVSCSFTTGSFGATTISAGSILAFAIYGVPAAASGITTTFYKLPGNRALTIGLTANQADNTVWFNDRNLATIPLSTEIGKISLSGAPTIYPMPVGPTASANAPSINCARSVDNANSPALSPPLGRMTSTPDGNVWSVVLSDYAVTTPNGYNPPTVGMPGYSACSIARITTTGNVAIYSDLNASSAGTGQNCDPALDLWNGAGIAVSETAKGGDGRIWLACFGGTVSSAGPLFPLVAPYYGVAAMDPSNGIFTFYPAPAQAQAKTAALTESSDGSLVASVYNGGTLPNAFERIATSGSYSSPVAPACANPCISNVALGPDGNVWFEESTGTLGTLSNANGVSSIALTGGSGAVLKADFTTGSDGNAWFFNPNSTVGSTAASLIRVSPAGVETDFPITLDPAALPINGFATARVVAGPPASKTLWLTFQGTPEILKVVIGP